MNNTFFGIVGVGIGWPLFVFLISLVYSLMPSWSWTYANPYFVWVMAPLSFTYLYLISCGIIAYLWRRIIKVADSRDRQQDSSTRQAAD
ncbi:hypothetical protein [Nitrososphaera viennensis]|uniref:Uncharacterized protein n=2 Tax=Nitrososphaera viennensis TaxID=1034015 RepID=A0A060HK14_9ARCH|nr:hypothetical protein [Nitrososphaera viennensis]AIC16874.1 hypothetical protein NVIE_026030 [Nitrososphaera viennensis EN76]UVS68777.1 hypothetical protein NWT39_12830 [Nitrososphaera viennensis]